MERSSSSVTSDRCRRHVVLLPYPGRGHIHPLLRLAHRLASCGFVTTVVLTQEWLSLLSASSPPLPPSVCFRSIPNVVPSERARGADLGSFIRAVLVDMGPPVAALLAELDPPPAVLVADSMLPWAPAIARRMDVPIAAFFPQAATIFLALQQLKALSPLEIERSISGNGSNYLDYVPRPTSSHLDDFITHSNGEGMLKAFIEGISWFATARCILFNTFNELETRALHALRSFVAVPFYSIGPLVADIVTEQTTKWYFSWLDSHLPRSVLYVSLSSFLPFTNEELKEIAIGLQMSGHPFLWSVPDSKDIEELIGQKGIVVPWCNQAEVLCHPSIGGFLTHCGWNSTLEGIHAGVPMLTFPLMWDQFPNSKLIVEDWGVGFSLKDDDKGVVSREVIAIAVRRLMDLYSAGSKELSKVMELKWKSHFASSTEVDFNNFIEKITSQGSVES
ncbi:UDP-glycosyltransferase 87A1-like [Curcuma longa]|uniref:UDP-glycosyltransferase 87A1-like n=1 Tax=Curcuma longa TaxID=136217 RepID=UPI003D9E37C9